MSTWLPVVIGLECARGDSRRSAACLALVALIALGCSARAEPEEVTARASESVEPTARATPSRAGLSAPVVLRLPKPQINAASSGCTSSQISQLRVDEVRSDTEALYFDVVHETPHPMGVADAGVNESEEVPTITVLVDRCHKVTPDLEGSVSRGDPSPSTLTVRLADLPDGELDVMLHAFDSEGVVTLRKVGREVTALTLQQRRDYDYVPAYPELGLPAAEGLIEPACTLKAERGTP